jgi:two-component sensor histidine kinase
LTISLPTHCHSRTPAHSIRQTESDRADFVNGLLTLIGSRPITLRAEVDAGQFPFAQAIALGLIVSELVTNALKYAFPEERPGTITVRLTKLGGYRLLVADDVVGRTGAALRSTGLGQKLIQSLVQPLGGSYEVHVEDSGRTCLVHFAVPCLPGLERRAGPAGQLVESNQCPPVP